MTSPMEGGRRRVDAVLAEDFLDGLSAWPMDELRRRRHEAEQEEVDLSYLRRLLHGRIDIVRAEQQRRGSGGAPLVDRLAEVLADDRPPARGMGRHLGVEPSRVSERRRRVEQAAADMAVSDVDSLDDDGLAAALARLEAHEAEVSGVRRRVQQVLDACTAELTRRYREGSASVDALLADAAAPPEG